MPIIEITKIKLTGGHIGIMLFIEMAKIELIGGFNGFMYLYRLPEWNSNYANCTDGKIEYTRGHIGFIFFYIDYQNEIRIMVIVEMAKKKIH